MNIARHILVLLLYLGITVGMTVSTHFCGGEPVSSSLLSGTEQSAGCCCGDEGEMEGCCSTSIDTVRLDDAHTVSSETFSGAFAAEQITATWDVLLPTAPRTLPPVLVHPPGISVPRHILACSFLI